jgi:hypothetical protein
MPVLLANDIVIIEDIISILNSFDIITKSVEKFVSTAIKHVEDRFNKICHSNQYKIATFLDPRFKNVMLDDLQSLREYIKKDMKQQRRRYY